LGRVALAVAVHAALKKMRLLKDVRYFIADSGDLSLLVVLIVVGIALVAMYFWA
jgi:phosphotransferase system  glucose/maltose/N-acetylglucosamine-specific IIC component